MLPPCRYTYFKFQFSYYVLSLNCSSPTGLPKIEDAPFIDYKNSLQYQSEWVHNALEKQEDGNIRRYKMRCTSCKSCIIACPFGTIFIDFIPYLDSRCDYCLNCVEKELPACIKSCPEGAIEYKEIEKEEPENNLYFVGEHLAVHTIKWFREEVLGRKNRGV